MNEQKYQYDLERLIRLLLPIKLRQSPTIDWLLALLHPLENLLNRFATYRSAERLKLSVSSQTIVLEKYLNDVFNAGLPGVYISHPLDELNNVGLFLVSENEGSTALYTVNEYATESLTPVGLGSYLISEYAAQYDFIVNIPATLTYNVDALNYTVNLYKIGGMRWTKQNY